MTTDILKTREAAAYVQLGVPTLNRLRITGEGARFLKLGKSVRYRKVDLDEWLASRLVASTSEVLP